MINKTSQNWQLVVGKKPKEVFNSYFLGWKTQLEVSKELTGKNHPDRHVNKYHTIFIKNNYLLERNEYNEERNRKVPLSTSTIKPYLDYLKDQHPNLLNPKISIFIQILTNEFELRKKMIGENRDIIRGINEMLILYWHSQTLISLLRESMAKDDVSFYELFSKSENVLAKQFVKLELEEKDLWPSAKEREQWWTDFLKAHAIDSSFFFTFRDTLQNKIIEEAKK
ncbi:MAG: hypothetical protein AABW79_00690 [Nanoarchaeota archaeon]